MWPSCPTFYHMLHRVFSAWGACFFSLLPFWGWGQCQPLVWVVQGMVSRVVPSWAAAAAEGAVIIAMLPWARWQDQVSSLDHCGRNSSVTMQGPKRLFMPNCFHGSRPENRFNFDICPYIYTTVAFTAHCVIGYLSQHIARSYCSSKNMMNTTII